jgi:hypothetical protein
VLQACRFVLRQVLEQPIGSLAFCYRKQATRADRCGSRVLKDHVELGVAASDLHREFQAFDIPHSVRTGTFEQMTRESMLESMSLLVYLPAEGSRAVLGYVRQLGR